MWFVAGIGLMGCVFTFFIGFLPPEQIQTGNSLFYILFLAISVVLFCLAPSFIFLFKKDSWKSPLDHE